MLWLGIGVGILVVGAVSMFFYLNSQVNAEIKAKNAEFDGLLKCAKSDRSLEKLVTCAAKTRFNEVTFYRLGSSEPLPPPSTALKNTTNKKFVSPFGMSAKDSEAAKKIAAELKKGKAVFADPEDNPMMYSRPYLRVEFDGDSVVNIADGNSG